MSRTPFTRGFSASCRPLHRLLHVVDDVQERKDDLSFTFLGKLVAVRLHATPIVREICKGTESPVTLFIQSLL